MKLRFKMPIIERRKLVRHLEVCYTRQKELLAEYAAACRYHDKPVPPTLGEVLGVVEGRIRNLQQLKPILLEGTSGPGVQSIIEDFMDDHDKDTEVVTSFLRGNEEAP